MITLGINAAFHDWPRRWSSTAGVVAAAEEERFTRIKHAKRPLPFTAWELPFHAIDYCLAEAGSHAGRRRPRRLQPRPARFLARPRVGRRRTIELPLRALARDARAASAGTSPWDPLFAAYVVERAARSWPTARRTTCASASPASRHAGRPYRWHFVDHHLCHQASAFLAAPFERCAVMTLDGRGERATTTYGVCARRRATARSRRGRDAAFARHALRAHHDATSASCIRATSTR